MRALELPALTGIRFYAALAVFLSHVSITAEMERLSSAHKILNLGVVGVSFFFVLSGFILTYNYAGIFKSGVPASGYKQFIWDRVSKIYPVHFATMLMAVPIQILSPNKPLDWRALPLHALLLQCWLPFTKTIFYNYLNVPSWSISCEWFFYLLAPVAIFCALGNIRRRLLLVTVIIAYACILGFSLHHNQSTFSRDFFVNWFAPSRFMDFVVGVFVARLFLSDNARRWAVMAVPAQITGIAWLASTAFLRDRAPWPLHGGLLYVPGAALLVFGLGYSKGAFAAHLARPWLRCLGMASFSFYMLHTPMFRVLRGIYFYFGWETRTWAGFWLVYIGAYVVIQTAAFIMLYRYELPMQKWLRQLRVRPTSTAQSVEILEPTLSLDNAYESTSVGQPKGLAVTHNGSTPRQAILGWTYAISGK